MKVKLVKETIGVIGKVAKKTKKAPKQGNMSELSSLKTLKTNMKGGQKQRNKNPNHDGLMRKLPAIQKPSWKQKASKAYGQAKKDIGGFAKTPTGKAAGKGLALATSAEVGYEIGKAKHQNVVTVKPGKTFKIKNNLK
jgi:hypothetical protein